MKAEPAGRYRREARCQARRDHVAVHAGSGAENGFGRVRCRRTLGPGFLTACCVISADVADGIGGYAGARDRAYATVRPARKQFDRELEDRSVCAADCPNSGGRRTQGRYPGT